jgi:hypothetical protein
MSFKIKREPIALVAVAKDLKIVAASLKENMEDYFDVEFSRRKTYFNEKADHCRS